MKRFLIGLIMIGVAMGVVACNSQSSSTAATTTSSELTSSTTDGTNVAYSSDTQVFAVEALSASSLMDYSGLSNLSTKPLALPLDASTTTTTENNTDTTTGTDTTAVISQTDLGTVDKYLNMIQDYLGNNDALGVTVTASDLPDWQYKVVYNTVDLAGNQVSYILYYNETVINDNSSSDTTTTTTTDTATTTDTQTTQSTDTTTTQSTDTATTTTTTTQPETTTTETQSTDTATTTTQEHPFMFKDSDDNLVVSSITGIIISGDSTYNVEGKKLVTDSGAQILRLRAYVDSHNFILVNYMTDSTDGIRKFFFQNVSDGQIIQRSNVRVFESDNETKVLLNITDGTGRGHYLFKMNTEDNVQYIHLVYNVFNTDGSHDNGNVFITATTDPTTGDVTYDYKVLSPGQNADKGLNGAQYKYNYKTQHRQRGRAEDHMPMNNHKAA